MTTLEVVGVIAKENLSLGPDSPVSSTEFIVPVSLIQLDSGEDVSAVTELYNRIDKAPLKYSNLMPYGNQVAESGDIYAFSYNGSTQLRRQYTMGLSYSFKKSIVPYDQIYPYGYVTSPGALIINGSNLPATYDKIVVSRDPFGINMFVYVYETLTIAPPYTSTAFAAIIGSDGWRLYQVFEKNEEFNTLYLVGAKVDTEEISVIDHFKSAFALAGDSSPKQLNVEPSRKSFYKSIIKPPDISVAYCSIRLELEDGTERTLSPDEFSYSVDSPEISYLSISPYVDTNEYQIIYSRPELLDISEFNITITYLADPTLVATITFFAIDNSDQPYLPGTGQGTPSQPGGGGGNFGINPDTGQPEVSDNVATDLPGIGINAPSTEPEVANVGLFTHYVCNNIKVAEFADWLWADNLGQAIMRDFASLFYGSPIESVISLMSYPFNVGAYAQTQTQNIKVGYNDTGIIASALTRTGIRIDWGTLQLTEFWGNFLDYAPHTKIELYLPWCTGFVPIDPHEVLPGSIQVITTVELAKGTCVHSIINHNGTVIGIHSGICGKQIPVTAVDFSGKYVSMVTSAVSTLVAGASAAVGAAAGAMAMGAPPVLGAAQGTLALSGNVSRALPGAVASAASTPSSPPRRTSNNSLRGSVAAFRTPPSVQRNGSFSDAGAGMGIQYPYLIISRPEQSVPSEYGHYYGYPSNIYASLSQLKGYTEIGEVHLDGITATDAEVDELDAILKGGVIF